MGSGKTAVGSALATILGWPLVDNDQDLRAREGRGLLELAEAGPEELHRREAEQLHATAVRPPPFIAGVAASVADRAADLALLRRTGTVVYLRATLPTLAGRIQHDADRPWVGEDPTAWLRTSLTRRAPAFTEVADVVVDVDTLSPAAAARSVLERLTAGSAGPSPARTREPS
jgi:shikimate kinase